MKLSKKHAIKIPKEIKVLYSAEKNILLLLRLEHQKTLKCDFKLLTNRKTNTIYVTETPSKTLINLRKKHLHALHGTTMAHIKSCISEVSTTSYKKIGLKGVGFKVFLTESVAAELLQFKLGFSHSIYYKIPKTVDVKISKQVYLFLFGMSYCSLGQAAANIRYHKIPDCYKGKGILHENEEVKIKEGKKI
jgi:ribosomal protein L6P/L9E